MPAQDSYDTAIVGSGVAGLAAGMYAARYNLKSLVIGRELGGETTTAWTIENYPGFKAIDGFDLVQKMKEQTVSSGVKVLDSPVETINRSGQSFKLKFDGGEISARAIILANGAKRRRLGLAGESDLVGRGVHYCATCDAPLYKNKVVAIVGGGDAAMKGANLAKDHAARVYLIVRGPKLKGEPINLAAITGADNLTVLAETKVNTIVGQDWLKGITLSRPYQGKTELEIDGLFIEIGAEADSGLAVQLGVKLDQFGYLAVDQMMKTSQPGVFAAGDNTNFFGHFKQILTAAAMGSVAATSAYEYLSQTSAD